MKLRYKRLLAIIFVLLIGLSAVGVSFAVYKSEKDDENATLVQTDEYLSINYLDG